MAISNDTEFKNALEGLSVVQRRAVAARFAERVLDLSEDPRVKGAVAAAKRADISDAELATLAQGARTATVESYTSCGKECDWNAQAGHFVAQAALACVSCPDGGNLAWDAAMHARMARTCQSIAGGEGTGNSEAEQQYGILDAFLSE